MEATHRAAVRFGFRRSTRRRWNHRNVQSAVPKRIYFTLAGTTTYTNLIHLRPSLELRPQENLKLIARLGLQWRQTTQDAVYVIPNRPVPGTAGRPGRWTGIYEQLRMEWQIDRNWAAALEGVPYQVGDVIRRAGGRNANYLGVELKFGW